VHQEARRRGFRILDTTCAFVYDIHDEARKALDEGAHLVFLGHAWHREVQGYTRDLPEGSFHVLSTLEEAESIDWEVYPSVRVFYQTTLNAEDFEDVVRHIERQARAVSRADTICLATRENQEAAMELAQDPDLDLILVVGGKESANTRHLWDICRALKSSRLVHTASDLKPSWFRQVRGVGITAGASTPDVVIDEVEDEVRRLCQDGDAKMRRPE
jgi:4-hydroxy-3-methylbut-2-enyl diphosphate reductase